MVIPQALCAAAATKVALTLTSGKELEMVELITLNNEHLIIPVENLKNLTTEFIVA